MMRATVSPHVATTLLAQRTILSSLALLAVVALVCVHTWYWSGKGIKVSIGTGVLNFWVTATLAATSNLTQLATDPHLSRGHGFQSEQASTPRVSLVAFARPMPQLKDRCPQRRAGLHGHKLYTKGHVISSIKAHFSHV